MRYNQIVIHAQVSMKSFRLKNFTFDWPNIIMFVLLYFEWNYDIVYGPWAYLI